MSASGSLQSSYGLVESSRLPLLGELEARVLEVVWDRGGWLTTREVLAILTRERRLAYTTVMTILVKLWRKGLLERTKDGRAFAYHAVLTREEWAARRMGELLSVAENHALALSHFVSGIGNADVSQLRRLLQAEE
jgi:BlaI family transcriptional regulator, penicillinase repressor